MANEGLLGKIGGALQGLLKNPTAQGIAGAAAFGANPLLGLLAAPGIKSSRDRRELKNETARRKFDAIDRVPSLLGQSTPTDRILDPVDGDAEGGMLIPSATPHGSVPFTSTRPGAAEMQGLLAAISPDTFVQGTMAGSGGSTGSSQLRKVQDFETFMGRKATPEEARNMFGANGESGLEMMRATIDLQRAQLDLINAENDADRETAEADVAAADYRNSLNTTFKNLFELADVNAGLAGTAQRPGVGADLRTNTAAGVSLGADLLGFDEFSEGVDRNVDLAQRFDTLSNEILIDSLNTGTFNASSDAKFKQFASSKPDRRQLGTRANNLAIADKFEAALLSADANNETLAPEYRAQIEAKVKELREEGLTPASLMQMSLEAINALDPEETDRWTEEQRLALAFRLDQLERSGAL